jgi:hypothetical protein
MEKFRVDAAPQRGQLVSPKGPIFDLKGATGSPQRGHGVSPKGPGTPHQGVKSRKPKGTNGEPQRGRSRSGAFSTCPVEAVEQHSTGRRASGPKVSNLKGATGSNATLTPKPFSGRSLGEPWLATHAGLSLGIVLHSLQSSEAAGNATFVKTPEHPCSGGENLRMASPTGSAG